MASQPPQTMVYTVDIGNGQVAEIEGPAGATPEQLQAAYHGSGGVDDTGDYKPVEQGSGPGQGDYITLPDGSRSLRVNIEGNGKPYEPETSTAGAIGRGALDAVSLGFADEAGAGVEAGLRSLLNGENMGEAYDTAVTRNRSLAGADENQHGYARFAGQLIGGLAIPVGFEGIAARAGLQAIKEGASLNEARIIAMEAAASRSGAAKLATQGATTGAVYGAGSADGDAGQRLLGAGVGAASGALAGGVLGAAGDAIAPRLAARSANSVAAGNAATQGARDVAAAAERRGIEILPQDIGGPAIQRATQGAAQTPFGAGAVSRAADRLYNTFDSRVSELGSGGASRREAGEIVGNQAQGEVSRAAAGAERTSAAVQDSIGAPTDATAAGQAVSRSFSRWTRETNDRAGRLYSAIPIDESSPANVSSTRRTLANLTEQMGSNPELGGLFRNRQLEGYLSALTPKRELVSDPTLMTGTRMTDVGGSLNWRDLLSFRSRVGEMLDDYQINGGETASKSLRQLYGSLSDDIKATAQDVGPDAFKAWKRANDYYDGRMKRINDTFSTVLGSKGDATPNEVFASLQGMLKAGRGENSPAFGRILRSLSPEDASTVRATIINQQRGGAAFDPQAFAKAWPTISDRAKSVLLPGRGQRELMDDAAFRASADTRNPFAGLSGEQVFSKLEQMASSRGDAVGFQQRLARLSPEEAGTVRSTFINHLGRAPASAQGADGNAFSINRWLTRWNGDAGGGQGLTDHAKDALFGRGELRAAMDDLATVAEKVKASERLSGHSNTGAVNSFNATTGGLGGAVIALLSGHPIVSAALAAPAGYQFISAHALTSPRLLRWLARAPKTSLSSEAYLDRLSRIAKAEPAIANDVFSLRDRLIDASRGSRPAAAQQESQGSQPVEP